MDVVKILDDKYELIREIKRGGFGVVYYGRDRLFGKPVAIKAISPDLLGEAKYIDMFQAESLSVARLNHHNIVRLYDIKRTDDGQFYIIMEFIDGVDVGKLISLNRKGAIKLPFLLGAYVMAQCCSGLDYAHARRDPDTHQPLNIVHQDISPGNIMVNRLGEIKIIDFGMAGARRRSSAQRGRKREILVQGKIAYLAPEQLNGAKGSDRRSDIFAAGLVLYEILTGERLLQKDDPAEIVEILEAGTWNFNQLAAKGIPEALQLVVQRAIQKHPESRYQTANQMYLDLMTYLASQEAASDLSVELGQLVQQLVPNEKSTAEALRHEALAEVVPVITKEAVLENGVHANAAPPVDIAFEPIAVEPVLENEASPRSDFQPPRRTDDLRAAAPIQEISFSFTDTSEISEKTITSEERNHKMDQPVQDVPFYQVLEEEEEDDEEIRTIIDVIRLSARSHKKTIIATVGGIIGVFLFFTILDTVMQWTSYGAAIYNFVFPPAIRLVSFPPNAQVSLDDKLLSQTTPLAINSISPGVHKLMLSLPRYEPIVRSIQVPPKGKTVVQGENAPKEDQPYVFRFKTTLELSSKPAGAHVYLNGIKYTQPTPCRVVWEVGSPLQIEMEKLGLARLSGFTFNSLEGVENIEDRRLWRFQRIEENREHYAVEGTFAKAIVINSTPPNAEIYIDGGERPVGVTGFTSRLLLTMGVHTISLKKKGFLPKNFTVQLDEYAPEEYNETLSRIVKIFSKAADGRSNSDLGATVLQLVYENNSTRVRATTPCEFTLQPYKYTALLRKDGYKDFVLTIPASGAVVIAPMERIHLNVEILVVDETSGEPIQGVQIRCRTLVSEGRESSAGDTDETGVTLKELAPGEYRFTARKAGYRDLTKDFMVNANNKNRLVFKMTPP